MNSRQNIDDLFASGDDEDTEETQGYVCPSCGFKFTVGEKFKFCSRCGSRVGEISTETTTEPPRTRVLLVDDSAIARRRVSSILRNLHCEVTEVEDGKKALALAAKLRPQLIVLDVHMPDVSGLQVLEILRQKEDFTTIPSS
jgi:PleD family two-component response regulator